MKDLNNERNEIQELGLNAIKEFFKIDVENIDKDIIHVIHNKAKIAMQFEKEINVGKRAIELNYLRVFRMVAEDKHELKNMIRKSLPQYFK
jgi:hypothetical protein